MTDIAHWPVQTNRKPQIASSLTMADLLAYAVFTASLLVAAAVTLGAV